MKTLEKLLRKLQMKFSNDFFNEDLHPKIELLIYEYESFLISRLLHTSQTPRCW